MGIKKFGTGDEGQVLRGPDGDPQGVESMSKEGSVSWTTQDEKDLKEEILEQDPSS